MKRSSESGVALLSAILVLMLMSAILVGFIALVTSDQNASGITRDQTQAYAAAHAATEKLTTDLGQLFTNNFSPTGAQVQALATNARQPNLGNGTSYVSPAGGSGYVIEFDDLTGPNGVGGPDGNPDLENPTGSQITDGVYAGLMGLITPYRMTVTARTVGGSEVRMRREMQTVAIPVFQFGIYSENDLSFFAGPDFNFGGRVHTNQNLYITQGSGGTLTMSDRITAVGEVVREYLSNGQDLGTSIGGGGTYNGTVRIARASNCPAILANCRNLLSTEDSVNMTAAPPVPPSVPVWVVGPPSRWEMQLRAPTTAWNGWDNISRAQYNSWIRNGATGARRLDLPIVDATAGTTPIDLIRRPMAGDPTGPGTPFQERFFRLASIRILLSDTAAEITNLPTVTATAPVNLATLVPGAGGYNAGMAPPSASDGAGGAALPNNTVTLTGFIKVERQLQDGVTWEDITLPILNLGIAGRNISNGTLNTPDVATCTSANADPFPDAVIRLQRVRDVPTNGFPCGVTAVGPPRVATNRARDYWPNVLYDAREATRRENDTPAAGQIYLGGVMHYVELDVNNLRRWLATGPAAGTMDTTGFVVYFSDRRGNKNAAVPAVETGEFGYEDIVNPNFGTGQANGVLDTGEDFNANGALDVYGDIPRLAGNAPLDNTARLRTLVAFNVGRTNPPTFFRRALKLVNGGAGQLPANGSQGLTVASENPVYIQGNYNACGTATTSCAAGGFGNNPGVDHVSAAVIADAVTLLSRNWNDIRSFTNPHNPGGRPGAETWYRLGIIAGKGISFPRPTTNGTADPKDFGTDGGAHNFLRFLESWPGDLNYRGSLISLYNTRQLTGVYKCCNIVYGPPARQYNFDVEFLNPTLLPPRTPMFRDINTLTFRQVLRPTQ
jgi:hypothetical protein